jgi:thiamine pyridinylase
MPGYGATKGELYGEPNPPVPPSGQNELNIALYKYVPSPQAFIAQTQRAWSKVQPQVKLNFVPYDTYEEPLSPYLDVFAFDCIFADDLVRGGLVDPILVSDIQDPRDLSEFAGDCVFIDGRYVAGIPYLGCTSVLFYRVGDPALAKQRPLGVDDLAEILGPAKEDAGPAPPYGSGLIMDFRGSTTNACIYANMWRQHHDVWWPQASPTEVPVKLDADAMKPMRAYAKMTGRAGALAPDDGHDRTSWFEAGRGRAFVGLTETMSGWSADFLDTITFRPLPIAARGNATHIPCYADAIGIRPGLGAKRAWAVQLANIVASAPVVLAALSPSPTKQYVIPARRSVLTQLAQMVPKYAEIEAMLRSLEQTPVRPYPPSDKPTVRAWARPAGRKIREELFSGATEELLAQPRRRPPGYESTPAGMWRRGE